MLEIAFRPDRTAREPVYRQLEGYLRGLIQAGRLLPGQKLPATRDLAESLGLSRNTVTLAYEGLVAAALAHAHVGQGTFVAARQRPVVLRGGAGGAPEPAPRSLAWEGLLAPQARSIRIPGGAKRARASSSARFDFRAGRVAAEALSEPDLRRAFGRAVARLPEVANAFEPLGLPDLRAEIARGLVARGIVCEARDVAVVNGAQHGLDCVARLLVDAGDTVIVEEPGYFGAVLAFSAHRANLVGVPVDTEGLDTDALARLLRARRAKLVVTTPAVQCPTGVALSEGRRQALLALADEHQVPILEDDYDADLRLAGVARPALKTLDPAGLVLYLGSFSKSLFPGLRLGYLVAPQPLLARLALLRVASDQQSSVVVQAALAELLSSGALERHLRRARREFAERTALLRTALERHLPGARVGQPAGGNGVWVELPRALDLDRLERAAEERGLLFTRGDLFWLAPDGVARLLLSVAQVPRERIEEGVALLAGLADREAGAARKASA